MCILPVVKDVDRRVKRVKRRMLEVNKGFMYIQRLTRGVTCRTSRPKLHPLIIQISQSDISSMSIAGRFL